MNKTVIPGAQQRKKFDPNFKREAVDLWRQSGKTASVVAAELGIKPERLYAWAKPLAAAPAPAAELSVTELAKQNAALRQENEYLRRQRDILKKTLGILSEAPHNGSNASTL